jgi:hypothetical protein
MKIIRLLLLALISATTAFGRDFPTVHPNEVISKYGKPDKIQSTEYDKPRPPFVTRMLEYKKQHVRFTFLPDAPIGSPPPYDRWKLIGTQDPRDNSVISASEAENRMQTRTKK